MTDESDRTATACATQIAQATPGARKNSGASNSVRRQFQDSDHDPRHALATLLAAKYLGVSAGSLRKWRRKRPADPGPHGPRFVKVGKNLVLYRVRDLDAWLDGEFGG